VALRRVPPRARATAEQGTRARFIDDANQMRDSVRALAGPLLREDQPTAASHDTRARILRGNPMQRARRLVKRCNAG
jgi:hypothetical protein